jgi:hypothetical protein
MPTFRPLIIEEGQVKEIPSDKRIHPEAIGLFEQPPLSGELLSTDYLLIQRNGVDYKITLSQILDLFDIEWAPPDYLDGGPAFSLQTSIVDGGVPPSTQDRVITGGSA